MTYKCYVRNEDFRRQVLGVVERDAAVTILVDKFCVCNKAEKNSQDKIL